MGQVLYIILACAFVIGLAYLTLRIMRSVMNRGTTSGYLQVIEAVPLGHKARLVLVRSSGQYLVLGVTEHSVTVVCELPDFDRPTAGEGVSEGEAAAGKVKDGIQDLLSRAANWGDLQG